MADKPLWLMLSADEASWLRAMLHEASDDVELEDLDEDGAVERDPSELTLDERAYLEVCAVLIRRLDAALRRRAS